VYVYVVLCIDHPENLIVCSFSRERKYKLYGNKVFHEALFCNKIGRNALFGDITGNNDNLTLKTGHKANSTPNSAADFGRITPNNGRIAGLLEFVSKLHGKVCRRRRRRRFVSREGLKNGYFQALFSVFLGSLSLLDFFQKKLGVDF
jgi:hypothetical protein